MDRKIALQLRNQEPWRETANLAGFDGIVERRIAAKEMTCASYTVCIDGEVVCQNALGLADIAAGRPLVANAVMRLASMTKPVTGVAVMRARELGLLDLDDEISRYIPAFAHMRVAEFDGDGNVVGSHPAETPITIRMLLNHSSGLGAGKVKCRAISEAGEGSTLASVVPRYAETPLDFEPLSATGYANLPFDIACRIVEVVSDMEYEQFIRKHILNPLGMADTTYAPSPEQLSRLATMYFCKGGEPVPASREEATHYPNVPVTFKAGGTRLFSTLPDYTRFAAMLCGGGAWRGIRILQPDSVRLMATPSLPAGLQGECEIWGLSMRVIRRQNWPGQPLPAGCFGWSGAFETHFFIDPALHLSAVLFKNIAGGFGAGAPTSREFEREVVSAFPRD